MSWKESEYKAFQWFKSNIDPNAEACGEEDSTIGDIYSPLYDSYIEVKDITNGARCGQFTESTIKNNPFAQAIYDGNANSDICSKFVQYHYSNKNVSHFIVIKDNDLVFLSWEEFFEKYKFEVQNPYTKRSGTRQAPIKDIDALLNLDADFYLAENGKVYCSDEKRFGEYVSLNTPFDYVIGKHPKTLGELRKRGTTQNMTWHLLIK